MSAHLTPGSPFGQSIESLATYLRYGHAISYERLHQRRDELADLTRHQYRSEIKRRLRKLLSLEPDQDDGRRLKNN